MNASHPLQPETQVCYTHLTPAEFRRRLAAAPIAYLPLGTLEWHGEHLPLGADGLQSQGFFNALARRAGGIVLPMLFVGPDRETMVAGRAFYGMDIVGFPAGQPQQLDGSAYWVADDLFQGLLEAILSQLARAGFKIVVAHGHGPAVNAFRKHRPAWSARFNVQLFTCWDETDGDAATGIQTDHAAANETSLMMALHPDLVKMEKLPADLDERPTAILGKDPRLYANTQAGQEILNKNLERMAGLLEQALLRQALLEKALQQQA